MRRWRWSFLATAGQFGYADGSEWGVSHDCVVRYPRAMPWNRTHNPVSPQKPS